MDKKLKYKIFFIDNFDSLSSNMYILTVGNVKYRVSKNIVTIQVLSNLKR